jgi:hypothetical protein
VSFVKFVPLSCRCHTPKATMAKSGTIFFNMIAKERYLSGATHVVLFYDADRQAVGVQPCAEKETGARPLRLRPNGADVGAAAFRNFFSIKNTETLSCDLKEEEGMITFYLKEGKARKQHKESS